jgi:hypothetical protein
VGSVLAVGDVQNVGSWIGLVSAIVSIVLSVVAIMFARDVDRRSLEINTQTIRSLEAIQAAVQRLSDDTGGLIKVAWERMLGSVSSNGPQPEPTHHGERTPMPKGWAFNAVADAIESISPLAVELLRALDGGHFLTRAQFQQLRQDPELAVAFDELRDRDLLMPFQRHGAKGAETVYGIAPWFHGVIGPALVFTDHEVPASPEAERVRAALRRAGYLTDEPEGAIRS